MLDEIANLVTLATLRAWHLKLIARKGPGRPGITKEITDLLLHMARENTSWGYDRLQGALGESRLLDVVWHSGKHLETPRY